MWIINRAKWFLSSASLGIGIYSNDWRFIIVAITAFIIISIGEGFLPCDDTFDKSECEATEK